MRGVFWQYALGKTQAGGISQFEAALKARNQKSIGYQRMRGQDVLGRNEFGLASEMQSQYVGRESGQRRFQRADG